jgi:uncharacterized membrane protein
MSARAPGRLRAQDEAGSTLLLTIFYAGLALLLILVALAATSLYLERKRLFTLADGAALAGAESFALDDVAVGPAGVRPELSSAEVRAAVREYLAAAPHPGLESLTVARAASVDGRSATVTLRAWWRPTVLRFLLPSGVPLDVTAVARSVFW